MSEVVPPVKGEDEKPYEKHVTSAVTQLDQITLLRAFMPGVKTITFADGKWTKTNPQHYAYFSVTAPRIRNLDDLKHQVRLAGERGEFAIHGTFKDGLDLTHVARRNVNLVDRPRRWIAIDFDDLYDYPRDPAEAAAKARLTLPAEFHGASCIWQASAGHWLEEGRAKLRLWFWFDRPVSLLEMKSWPGIRESKPDLALWQMLQPIYLSVDVKGAPDFVKPRMGRLTGVHDVMVPEIDTAPVRAAETRSMVLPEGVTANSPHMIVKALRTLKTRDDAKINETGRARAWTLAAIDFLDYAVTEEIIEAALACWSFPSDETEQGLIEVLIEAGLKDAAEQASWVRHVRHGQEIEWTEDKIHDRVRVARRERKTPIGSKWRAAPGEEFGDVTAAVEAEMALDAELAAKAKIAKVDLLQAWRDVKFGWQMGDMDRPAEVLLKTAHDAGVKPRIIRDVEALLYRVGRGDIEVPDEFPGLVVSPKPTKKRFLSRKDIREQKLQATDWLVKDLIIAGDIFIVHSLPKTGKSMIIADILYHIAHGLRWAGREVKQTGVLYVCSEGVASLPKRQNAWHERKKKCGFVEGDNPPIELLTHQIDMFNSDDHLKEISEQIASFKDRYGVECGIVVFDTFRQVSPGCNENFAPDVSRVTARFARLRDAHGCAVGFIHHSGKNVDNGAAGSTAFTGNVDNELIVEKKDGRRTLKSGVMRDIEVPSVISFRLETIELGLNDKGEMEKAGVAVVEGSAFNTPVRGDDEGPAANLGDMPNAEPPPPADSETARKAYMAEAARVLGADDAEFTGPQLYDKALEIRIERMGEGAPPLSLHRMKVLKPYLVVSKIIEQIGDGRSAKYRLKKGA